MCEPASLVAEYTRIRLANRLVGRNTNRPAMGRCGALRDLRGTCPCPSVLSCARRSQRPSSPQVSINFVANGIRQLQIQLPTEIRDCRAGSPLQGEGRRFDPVSTHKCRAIHRHATTIRPSRPYRALSRCDESPSSSCANDVGFCQWVTARLDTAMPGSAEPVTVCGMPVVSSSQYTVTPLEPS
jgi:hypothetical protein